MDLTRRLTCSLYHVLSLTLILLNFAQLGKPQNPPGFTPLTNPGLNRICTVNSPTGGLLYRINETAAGSPMPNLVLDMTEDVFGDAQHIRLEFIENPGNFFTLQGKRLRLSQPLDRDTLSSDTLALRLRCTFSVSRGFAFGQAQTYQREIPISVIVDDLNDMAPVFQNTPYRLEVSEETPVGQTLFRGIQATDGDVSQEFSTVEYQIIPSGGSPPGSETYFRLNSPTQAHVVLAKKLDGQFTQARVLVAALDNPGRPLVDRKSTVTTLDISVIGSQRQKQLAPAFIHPDCQEGGRNRIPCENVEYRAMIRAGEVPPQNNLLTVVPSPIQAVVPNSPGSPVGYQILNGTPPDFRTYFDIRSETGALVQKQVVPAGYADLVELTVQAKDASGQGNAASMGKMLIEIDSTGQNAHDPVLSASALEGYISENAQIGSTVRIDPGPDAKPLQVLVTDLDLKPGMPPATYQYVLTNSGAGIFAINQGGYVYLNSPKLDSDPPKPQRYQLTIEGREVGTSPIRKSKPLTININLIDRNDHTPTFENQVHNVRVKPGVAPIAILKLGATDPDASFFGTIQYRISSVTDNAEGSFYYLPQNETLMAIRPLTPGQQYQVILEARDMGGQTSQAIIIVDVEPEEITGLPPAATQNLATQSGTTPTTTSQSTITTESQLPLGNSNQGAVLKIPENLNPGTQITQIQAAVVGQGPKDLQYFILSGNENGDFTLDPNTGILAVAKQLSISRQKVYNLQLQAANSLGVSNSTSLRIELEPVEFSPPKILNPQPIRFTLASTAPGMDVGQIVTTTGGGAQVFYDITPPIPYFRILNNGTIRTTEMITQAQESELQLTVSAYSGQMGSNKFVSVPVTVLIQKPVVPEVPKFDAAIYQTEIPENFPPRPLVNVHASSDRNQRVTYQMLQGDATLFSVDPNKGTVSTQGSLDAELAAQYTLVIGTKEGAGSTEQKATTTVQVKVLDVNDWTPAFNPPIYSAALKDDVPVGTKIATVHATDQDRDSPNNMVFYSLANTSQYATHFFVHPQTGDITTTSSLTSIPQSDITIQVEAKDAGIPILSRTATVNIKLQHQLTTLGTLPTVPTWTTKATLPPTTAHVPPTTQRQPIQFSIQNPRADVPESMQPPHTVAIIQVQNAPADKSVVCTIVDGNIGNVFTIRTTAKKECELIATSFLDREKVQEYVLNVSAAVQNGQQGWDQTFGEYHVSVTDANDHAPVFHYPPHQMALVNPPAYFGALDANAPAGTTGWLRINASDQDLGINSRLTYQLETYAPDHRYFKINPQTGDLMNDANLWEVHRTAQGRPAYFELQATATDSPIGRSPLTATTPIIVNLIRPENRFLVRTTMPRSQRASNVNPKLISDAQIAKLSGVLQSQSQACKLFGLEKLEESQNISTPDRIQVTLTMYAIDPISKTICTTDKLEGITKPAFIAKATKQVAGPDFNLVTIQRFNEASTSWPGLNGTSTISSAGQSWWTPTNIGLVAAACFVALASAFGIICLCCCWARSKSQVKRALYMNGNATGGHPMSKKPNMYAVFAPTLPMANGGAGGGRNGYPKGGRRGSSYYDKEYETQMLEMAMSEDLPAKDGLDVGFTVQDGVYSIRAAQPYGYHHPSALYT